MNLKHFEHLNLDENIQWGESIENPNTDLFFVPKIQNVVVQERNIVGKKTKTPTQWNVLYTHNSDNDVVPISVKTHHYHIVNNVALHNIISSVPQIPFSFQQDKSNHQNHARFQIVYKYEPIVKRTNTAGENGDLMLVVTNSYDGSKKLKLELGFFRMICSNMCVFPEISVVISDKHFHGNFQDDLEKRIHKFIIEAMSEKNLIHLFGTIEDWKHCKDVDLNPDFFRLIPFSHVVFYFGAFIGHQENMDISINDNVTGGYIDVTFKENLNESTIQFMLDVLYRIKKRDAKATINNREMDYFQTLFNLGMNVSYPERVATQWDLYNMMLKMSHAIVKQADRIEYARRLSNAFVLRRK